MALCNGIRAALALEGERAMPTSDAQKSMSMLVFRFTPCARQRLPFTANWCLEHPIGQKASALKTSNPPSLPCAILPQARACGTTPHPKDQRPKETSPFAVHTVHKPPSKKARASMTKSASSSVQLIDAEGDNRGETDTREALELAQSAGLDLVEISPNANPPVCKIMDYGRFKYQQQKKAAEAKKKQKTVEVKEIKMRPNIDTHDYDVKMRNARRFFNTGDKVKFTLRFRGREMAHQNLGMDVLMKVKEETEEYAKVEAHPKMEGRQMMMVLAPIPAMVGKIDVKGEHEPENDGPDDGEDERLEKPRFGGDFLSSHRKAVIGLLSCRSSRYGSRKRNLSPSLLVAVGWHPALPVAHLSAR
jgi:translation initiation factor IF-3